MQEKKGGAAFRRPREQRTVNREQRARGKRATGGDVGEGQIGEPQISQIKADFWPATAGRTARIRKGAPLRGDRWGVGEATSAAVLVVLMSYRVVQEGGRGAGLYIVKDKGGRRERKKRGVEGPREGCLRNP